MEWFEVYLGLFHILRLGLGWRGERCQLLINLSLSLFFILDFCGSQVIGGSPNGAILINLSLPAGMCEQGDIIFGVEGLGP